MFFLSLLRPWHWIKNLFVFVPIFFAGEVFILEKLGQSAITFLVFCFAASSVYIINDIADVKQDAAHPIKRNRPIASGKVSIRQALAILLFLLVGVSLLIYFLIPQIAPVIGLYVLLGVSYSFLLKDLQFFDILTVSGFYLLRMLAGGAAINISISKWLILCTIFVTLFLIIAKRRGGFFQSYGKNLLDHLLTVSLTLTLISYGIYTVLGVDSPLAVYSIFFVMLGLFRYFFLIFDSNKVEYPEKLILLDKTIILSIVGWIIFMYFVVYIT